MKRRTSCKEGEGEPAAAAIGIGDGDGGGEEEEEISLKRTRQDNGKGHEQEQEKKKCNSKARKVVKVMKHPPNKVGGSVKKQEIYVSRKSNFMALYQRALRLLNDDSQGEGTGTVTLHGLGASIERCVELALKIQETQHAVLETTTSSEELIDEVMPSTEDDLPEWKVRVNSAIHIKITNRKL